MRILRISRRAYRAASYSRLATYAENAFNRTKGNGAYQAVQVQAEALETPLAVYKAALLAAENGGKSEILAKKIARQKLIEALDNLVDGLEKMDNISLQLIVDAGFSVNPEISAARMAKLPPPLILLAASTGKRGEVKILIKNEFPQAVKMYAVEYSPDGGVSWLTAGYHNHRSFTIDGLPTSSDLLIRVIALGASGIKSEWSEPVRTAVL